ncbi:MAG: hypothetical protein JNJ73_16165 [Hyphomonadaceae bacterium]|nr:hypothetical protein [Hyphomonadaceae bacterium]
MHGRALASGAALLALTLAASAPPALGQAGAPLVAGPTAGSSVGAPLILGGSRPPAPDSDAPLAGAPPAPPEPPPAVEPQQATGASRLPAPVEMGDIQQLDVWSVGVLPRTDGGLPNSLWAGSDAAALGALFDRLPASIDSPAARTLARRALASAGEAPGGAAADAGRKRVSALARMGFADDVAAMATAASAAFTEPNIAQFAAQSELARNRRGEACVRVRAAVGDAPPPFILRMRAYCAAAQGDAAMTDLALEVARSANAEDAWFRTAIGALISRPARPPAARYDTPLNAAVSLAAGLAPAAGNSIASSTPLALLAIARSRDAPTPLLRANAAAAAFRRGVLSKAEAREAIRAAIAAPPAPAPGFIGAVRDVEAQPGTLIAATAIDRALKQSSAYGDFVAAARLFQEDIARLSQAPDPPATLLLARAAAAIGDTPLAARLAYSAQQANADPVGVARVRAAIALDDPGALSDRIAAGGPSVGRDAAILAEHQALNADGRAFLASHPPVGGVRGDGALLAALQAAANRRAVGETAILASLLAAPGAHTLDAETLAVIIRALRTVGLDDDARAIAVEALVGPPPAT